MSTCNSTCNDRRYPADICRERGWGVGTHLVGSNDLGTTEIEITAIGQQVMLARLVSQDGRPAAYDQDRAWRLSDRDWHDAAGRA